MKSSRGILATAAHEGVNPGDKLVITYSEAVAMQVSAPKAK